MGAGGTALAWQPRALQTGRKQVTTVHMSLDLSFLLSHAQFTGRTQRGLSVCPESHSL